MSALLAWLGRQEDAASTAEGLDVSIPEEVKDEVDVSSVSNVNNTTSLRLIIPGKPVGKGRPRFYNGRAITPPKTRKWEKMAAGIMEEAWRGPALSQPCSVSVTAIHPSPKKHSKEREAFLPWCPGGGRIPDVDNVLKAVLDALQMANVLSDDRWVVEVSGTSLYARTPDEVGVVVRVEAL